MPSKIQIEGNDYNNNNRVELIQRVTERRKFILNEGKFVRGVSPNIDPEQPPPWFEKESFEHAQKLFHTYQAIIFFSQFIGLNLILSFSSGLLPLLATGNSKTVSKLFVRYLSTLIHVRNWFEFDPFDPKSKAFQSLKIVRGMHEKVSTKMNTATGLEEDGKTVLWIPQHGMCQAQFSFVGLMAVFPKQLGFHNFSEKDFHAMFHFWRLIGYCLGTDDQFNLCSGSDEETVELCRQIYFEEWLPVLKSRKEKTGIEMSKGTCLAMSKVNRLINYNAIMHYCASFLQLNPEDYPLKNLREKFLYILGYLCCKFLSKFKFFNWLSARIGDLEMKRVISKKNVIEKNLKEKYSSITFENDQCPFNVEFDYVSAI